MIIGPLGPVMANMLSIGNASAMSMPESARLCRARRFTAGFPDNSQKHKTQNAELSKKSLLGINRLLRFLATKIKYFN
jgi:hypothetical protein